MFRDEDEPLPAYAPSSPGHDWIEAPTLHELPDVAPAESAWLPWDLTHVEQGYDPSRSYAFQYYEMAPEGFAHAVEVPDEDAEEFEWALYEIDIAFRPKPQLETTWLRWAWPADASLECEFAALLFLQEHAGVTFLSKRYDLRPRSSYVLALDTACTLLRDRLLPSHERTPRQLFDGLARAMRGVELCDARGTPLSRRELKRYAGLVYARIPVQQLYPWMMRGRAYARLHAENIEARAS